MEIERQKIRALAPLEQPRTAQEFKAKQARAAQLLRGDLEGEDLQRYVEERVVTTRLEDVLNWARANAMFPMTFGLACCAIEMMSMVSARYDIARFGAEAFRASPRQADLMILSGRVSIKMAPVVRRIYDQMLEPKWAISMGACSSSGGMFANYAVVQGADKFMPVDMHIPGCPPRPEALLYGFNKLQQKILGNPEQGWRQRYNAAGTEEWARGGSGSMPSPEAAAAYAAARELVIAGEGSTQFNLPPEAEQAVAATGPTLPAAPSGHGPGEEAGRDA